MKHRSDQSATDTDRRRVGQKEVESIFAADYITYQYNVVNFLADHLADVSRAFEGDMQKAVMLAVIGQVHLNMMVSSASNGRNADDLPPERKGITTNRLSDSTGISRETTRRKLLQMEKAGWLVRDNGYWALAMAGPDAVARHDLAGLDSRAIKRTAALFVALANLVRGDND